MRHAKHKLTGKAICGSIEKTTNDIKKIYCRECQERIGQIKKAIERNGKKLDNFIEFK